MKNNELLINAKRAVLGKLEEKTSWGKNVLASELDLVFDALIKDNSEPAKVTNYFVRYTIREMHKDPTLAKCSIFSGEYNIGAILFELTNDIVRDNPDAYNPSVEILSISKL